MDSPILFIYRERYGVRNGERLDKLNKEKGIDKFNQEEGKKRRR